MLYAWALSPLTGIGVAGTGAGGTLLAVLASVIPAAIMVHLSRQAERKARAEAEEGQKVAA